MKVPPRDRRFPAMRARRQIWQRAEIKAKTLRTPRRPPLMESLVTPNCFPPTGTPADKRRSSPRQSSPRASPPSGLNQNIRCAACAYVFRGVDATVALLGHIQLFHNPGAHLGQPGGATAPRAGGGGPKRPNLDRPKVSDQCSPAGWEDFIKKWGCTPPRFLPRRAGSPLFFSNFRNVDRP